MPCALVFVFFFFCVGVVATSVEFQNSQVPAAVPPFWIASFNHYREVFSNVSQIPEVCWSGSAVNDFQVHQCDQYWGHLLKSGGLALASFVLVALFLFLSLDNLNGTYKRARKRAEKGKAAFGGTVTNPAEGPGDIFSWFYCLRPVMVELQDKRQLKVYVPLEFSAPTPGQTLAVFEEISSFGEKRRLAVLYAPHVAVVRGA